MEGDRRRGGGKPPALTLKLPENPVVHLRGRKEQQWPASEGRCWPGFHGPETGPAPHPWDFLLVCNPFPPSQRDHLCQQVGTAMACVSPRASVLPPVPGTVCALRRSSPPPSPPVHLRCCCRPPHRLSWPHVPHFMTTLQGAPRPSLWPPLHFGTCWAWCSGTALSTRRARRTPALRLHKE